MAGSSLIHVKIEHSEAVHSKREILSSEVGVLKIAKTIKKYHLLRVEELKAKAKLHRKLKELETSLGKMHTTLPKVKIPEISKVIHLDGPVESMDKKLAKVKAKHYDSEIENQLAEIQAKLRELQAA